MMKYSLLAAAPVLAIGLAFPAQTDVDAANAPSASLVTEKQDNEIAISQQLQVVEEQFSSINYKLNGIISKVKNDKTVSKEERSHYLDQLNSLLYQSNTASRQLDTITHQLGKDTLETVDVKNKINTTTAQILETKHLL